MDSTHKSYLTLANGDELAVTVHMDYQHYERETLTYPGCEEDAEVLSVDVTESGEPIFCTDETIERFRMEFLDAVKAERDAA